MAKISREEVSNASQQPSNELTYLQNTGKPIFWPKVRKSS
jgi:hypothetical protein